MDTVLRDLKACSPDTPPFSLYGTNTFARIHDIIDGDTMVVILPVFNHFFKFHIRVLGINTPELKSPDPTVREQAHEAKKRAFEFLTTSTLDSYDKASVTTYFQNKCVYVWLECQRFEKYGRVLANVYKVDDLNDMNPPTNTQSLAAYLLRCNLAIQYMG